MGGDGRPFVPNPTCRICWLRAKVSCASCHCFELTTPATVILVLATNFEFLFDIGQVSACYVPILEEKKKHRTADVHFTLTHESECCNQKKITISTSRKILKGQQIHHPAPLSWCFQFYEKEKLPLNTTGVVWRLFFSSLFGKGV